MTLRAIPEDISRVGDNPQRLLSILSQSFLLEEPEPFAWPEEELSGLGRLAFHRVSGANRGSPSHLPPTLLSGLCGGGAPFGYIVASDGEALTVVVGTVAARAPRLAAAVAAALQVQALAPVPLERSWLSPAHAACLSGCPVPVERLGRALGDQALLDLVADALRGCPFLWAVFATPEPRDLLEQNLKGARQVAEELERGTLRLGAHGQIERVGARARELLERHLRRVESALGAGGWRTAALLAAPDADVLRSGLGILRAGLEDGEPGSVPLRALACNGRRPPSGYPAHHGLLLSHELASLCLLPGRDRCGFERLRSAAFDVEHSTAGDVELGQIIDAGHVTSRRLLVPLSALCRHAFVTGMTGSGKSTTMRNVLLNCARRGKPFLVLEPAKAEYAEMPVADLLVLRVGALPIAGEIPLQFNPFYFPEGFPLHTHIDHLKQAFVASFGLFPPTPFLLETALYRVYESRGWNLGTGAHRLGRQRLAFPTLSDLLGEVDVVVDAAGYDSELSRNLKGALKTRLGNLCIGPKGLAFDTRDNTPESLLFERPAVVQLKDLGSDEEKALVMGLILMRLYQYRETRGRPARAEDLRHLLVIEEAHRLLRNTPERSSEEGNMAHHAVQAFTQLLAEVRAYGQGVIVVEQLPGKLAPDAIKNTGLKIVHRLSPRDDRDVVGDMMLLDDAQKRDLAALEPGVAVVHFGGMDGAVKIRAPLPRDGSAPPQHMALSALPRPVQARCEALQRRAAFQRLLRRESVCKVADRFLFRTMGGESLGREQAALGTCVDSGDLPNIGGVSPADVRRRLTVFATEDALERRSLTYGWSDAELERFQELLSTNPVTFVADYRKALEVGAGPFAACRGCPAPCTSLYEARAAAKTAPFLDDLADALNQSDPLAAAVSAIDRHVADVFDVAAHAAQALEFCLLREGLERLGLQRSTVHRMLNTLTKKRSP
jgi:hypothetical protein